MRKALYYIWDRFADRMEEILFLAGAIINVLDEIHTAVSRFLRAVGTKAPLILKDPNTAMNIVFLLIFLAVMFG